MFTTSFLLSLKEKLYLLFLSVYFVGVVCKNCANYANLLMCHCAFYESTDDKTL